MVLIVSYRQCGIRTMMHQAQDDAAWKVSPGASQHRRFVWSGGVFETAKRPHTDFVEGTIRSSSYLVMATLKGGARRHEFITDEGFRFSGSDRVGCVSYLPADCARNLKLSDVSWEWAAIALPPDERSSLPERPFNAERDDFVLGMLNQFRTLHAADGALDFTYCDTMALALRAYLCIRGEETGKVATIHSGGLTPRQLRDVANYVDAQLADGIRIGDLAVLAGLSEGYFHRAFRRTTGRSPLQYINEKRVERAAELLARTDKSVIEVALGVGFVSASHFARTFRAIVGVAPNLYRRGL
jgi:AraC family transcriptional regulator